ncbi:uncharacterized protein ACOB8E_000069 isoform 1-T2 [Sarcophilus harrisii]
MLNFIDWLWNLFFLFLVAYSHVSGICYSEVVSSLNMSQKSDAVFKLDPKIGSDPQRIMWILTSKHLILANSSAGESSSDWIINSKQYEGRLSLLPDKSLRLRNLKIEDSGCYEADIKSFLGVITIQKFNLMVLETESTKPNVNLWIMVPIVISVLAIVGLIKACVYYQKQRGTHRRRIPHNEENGPEEN